MDIDLQFWRGLVSRKLGLKAQKEVNKEETDHFSKIHNLSKEYLS